MDRFINIYKYMYKSIHNNSRMFLTNSNTIIHSQELVYITYPPFLNSDV